MLSAMKSPTPVLIVAAVVFAACASTTEQRTTQGPTAEELWMYRVMLQNGREPNFDERRHWEDRMDRSISEYLNEHPAVANSLQRSNFTFLRQVGVGMSKEQVLLLLGPPLVTTTDATEMEKLARRYWPEIKATVTEAWIYPLGWNFYFAGANVVDITQYLKH